MTDPELRVRQAFQNLEPAPDLNARTLDFIGAQRQSAPSPAKKRRKPIFLAAAFAAAACFIAAAVGIFATSSQITAYVDIDINPSLELGINRFGTVVSAEGVNEDGAAVMAALDTEGVILTGLSYEAAAEQLAVSNTLGAYLDEGAFAQFSVVCDNDAQATQLQQATENCFATLPCAASCQRATAEDHQAAQDVGMGVGRYQAACQLMEKDSSYTLEECSHMTMRQLRDALETAEGATHHGAENGSHAGHQGKMNATD